jgi:hypothetical protein
MKRCAVILFVALVVAQPASAQGLSDLISQLFIFGSGDDPLFLAGTNDPNNPVSIQAHAGHFVPSAVEGNGTLISFLGTAIGTSISNLPISSTSSGQTYRFEGGVPILSSTSAGPIFAERAQTLGKGRILVGATYNAFQFHKVRGVDIDNIDLTFTHVNADFEGCDTIFGGDCSLVGIPGLENDYMDLELDLNLYVKATVFTLNYGLLDFLDIGVAVPVISTSLSGTSLAQVRPFGGPTAAHFFDGTTADPELSASRAVTGSATGLGDVATRLKARIAQNDKSAFAILADARFATGAQEDFLGAGHFSIRGVGIASAQFGNFSPHANVGYVYRDSDILTDALLATIGFDQMLASWATLALDLITELQVGASNLTLPAPYTFDVPFQRSVNQSNIPNIRDDIINGSVGMKFVTAPGLLIITNALIPLNKGGLRTNVGFTVGLEYGF